MGSKRSYDGDEHMQLPYKYQKQFATDEKLISYAEGQTVVDKGFAVVFRSPWNMNCQDDDRGWHKDFNISLSPEYFESSFPRRASVLVDDPLSSFLNSYPRKQVPVGVNHQAELPEWVSPKSDRKVDEMEKFMGTCIIPMPDSSLPTPDILPAVVGREDCDCVDRGSVRCVRQHVKEAQEKLVNALGEDRFRALAFGDMGEEVTHKWSQEEEHVFHEVVFSNPASLGKDFWLCLLEEFPTRSMRDLVSYYFNVFMLRKRAAQNRSQFLDIDSDDDEWHPGHGRSYGFDVVREDDDSLLVHDEDSSDEDDSDDDNNDGGEHTSGESDGEKTPQLNIGFPQKESNSILGNRDDSCVSFEFQSVINDSTPSETGIATEEINGPKTEKYFSSDQTDHTHGCLDYSNFRQWDRGFSAGFDHLLPTENMIEEIFGAGSWDNKPDHG